MPYILADPASFFISVNIFFADVLLILLQEIKIGENRYRDSLHELGNSSGQIQD